LKTRGRRHSPGEKRLMQQVAEEFGKKKKELGAKEAAKALNVCLASFYNYLAGTDLPRIETLDDAREKWGIKWDLIDTEEMLRKKRVDSAEQFVFSFIDAVRKEDVEVSRVGPQGSTVLEVRFRIRFPA
jgi:hypothetical protein